MAGQARRRPAAATPKPAPPAPPPAETPAPDAPPGSDLSAEIEMLRRAIHRLVQMAAENRLDPVRALEAISAATNRLAQVVSTQAQLHGGDDAVRAALYLALEACWNEIRQDR